MRNFKQLLIKLLLLNSVFLAIMTVFRFAFFLFYGKAIDFSGLSLDILKAFYMGVRYDAAVLAYLNIPVTLALIIILFINKSSILNKIINFIKNYYIAIIGSLFVLLAIDFGYYSYFQNHMNILIYGLFEDDTWALITTLHENYNAFLVIIGFASSYVVVYFLTKFIIKKQEVFQKTPYKIYTKITLSLVLVVLNFMVARGSFGIFPLGVDDAEVSSNAFINKVAINGIYTLQAAIESRGKENRGFDYISKTGYSGNIRQAFADFLEINMSKIPANNPENSLLVKLPPNKTVEKVKPNVIFIMMESFGADLIKYNSKDFNVMGELKKHFDEDILFTNFLPGHRGTIASLEAAIMNIANKPLSKNISQTKFAYESYYFAGPKVFQKNGYETIFIYGGNTGWRNVGSFMPNVGFDLVLGEGGMPKEYERNQWGVYDEYLFDFIFTTLEKDNKQKFIYALSTTNHPPYSLPDSYKPYSLVIPENIEKKIVAKNLVEKRFQTYQYSCEMLGRFISRIKKSKYAGNTIIVVTGDHNFLDAFTYSSEELLDSISVPLYIYIPAKLKPNKIDTSVFGSHLDIMPTIYNLSLSNTQYTAMGMNLFSQAAKNNVAFIDDEIVMDKNAVIRYNVQNNNSVNYKWSLDNTNKVREVQKDLSHQRLIKKYKATIAVADYMLKNLGK